MKLVLNKCYGCFSVGDEAMRALCLNSPFEADRYDAKLIALVEINAKFTSGEYSALYVVEIPDEITDYHIIATEGYESIIYVLDGKLHWA